MAKTLSPINHALPQLQSKSALKHANVQVNDVPTSFRLLQQKPKASGISASSTASTSDGPAATADAAPHLVPAPPVVAEGDGVRVVTAAEYKQAALCLAEAFAQDDVARYFVDVPDREHWTEEQRWALHVEILEYITYAHILKGLVTTTGDFEAVALWMPPHTHMDDLLTMFRSGMWRLNYRLSPEARKRFFTEFLPLLHDTKLASLGVRDSQSWYLVYIGTRPAGRGKGHARRLIEHVTRQADRDGRACYLESSNEANPPIYRKFGFECNRRVYLQRAERNVALDVMIREPVGGVVVGKKGAV